MEPCRKVARAKSEVPFSASLGLPDLGATPRTGKTAGDIPAESGKGKLKPNQRFGAKVGEFGSGSQILARLAARDIPRTHAKSRRAASSSP